MEDLWLWIGDFLSNMFNSDLIFETFCKNDVLLLQGPVGPFFKQLAIYLKKHKKINVIKVNFNGGDLFFYPKGSIQFRDHLSLWPKKLKEIIQTKNIKQIVVFGDCRPIHKIASQIAKQMHIEFVVFEEGYIRPDYITIERNGVNGLSQLPRKRRFYEALPVPKEINTISLGNTFFHAAFWAIIYYLMSVILTPMFRNYQHHRPLNSMELYYWSRSIYIRRWWYKYKEKGIQKKLTGLLHKKYFLVPLQVHNDAQITQYSSYLCIEQFIEQTISEFARYAPKDMFLVIKHHPMDRGYVDYKYLISHISARFNINERIYYIHDQHLPSLLSSAAGVVTINSTVGLSALYHSTPVIIMGRAIYNIDGLTYQDTLGSFFANQPVVNKELYQKFVHYLICKTQVNGNFYKIVRNP